MLFKDYFVDIKSTEYQKDGGYDALVRIGGNAMNEKEIKAYSIEYFKDCELRKRLSQKTLKAYRIDVNQYAAYIGIDQA